MKVNMQNSLPDADLTPKMQSKGHLPPCAIVRKITKLLTYDIKKSRMNMSLQVRSMRFFPAGVAQWQSIGFPSRQRGFDSHHLLQPASTAMSSDYFASYCDKLGGDTNG